MTYTLALMGAGFVHAIAPVNLLAMLLSTIVGITIGCLPGLSAAMGVALLLPVTFGMDCLAASIAAQFSAVPSAPFLSIRRARPRRRQRPLRAIS